jgi:aryl-alcohol dehydrogenase-like predicted oxidoreductase
MRQHDPRWRRATRARSASSVSQLEANAAAADITLTPDERQALTSAASQVRG